MAVDLPPSFNSVLFTGRAYGVTGGGRGIGRAIVLELLRHGASVLAIDRDAAGLERLPALAGQASEALLTVTADVVEGDALDQAVAAGVARFGRLDGWVNNAMLNPRGSIEEISVEAFTRAWEVNTLAAWRTARLCLPHFRALGGGAMVNISSIMAYQTTRHQTGYTSSKAAVEGLTRALAVELAVDRVRVNAVAPGYILSYSGLPDPLDGPPKDPELREQVETQRFLHERQQPWPAAGQPRDIADPVLFLLSDAARFITGTCLDVNGGASVDLRNLRDPRRIAALRELEERRQAEKAGAAD